MGPWAIIAFHWAGGWFEVVVKNNDSGEIRRAKMTTDDLAEFAVEHPRE